MLLSCFDVVVVVVVMCGTTANQCNTPFTLCNNKPVIEMIEPDV